MLSAFTCYANYHSTVNNEKEVCKNLTFFPKIFENYLFQKRSAILNRRHQSLLPDMQNIILPPITRK